MGHVGHEIGLRGHRSLRLVEHDREVLRGLIALGHCSLEVQALTKKVVSDRGADEHRQRGRFDRRELLWCLLDDDVPKEVGADGEERVGERKGGRPGQLARQHRLRARVVVRLKHR